ncbi:hypothetical protein MMC28_011453, partial [Mycoblastus sanguinarius]|nr:hypothetical protein [Mycoblastus sanguinarius]
MSESVPSSVTGFAHRRPRADSVASFTYFQEDDESPEWSEDQAVINEVDESIDNGQEPEEDLQYDLESGSLSPKRRKSSGFSRPSVEDPLLYRHDSTKTDASALGRGARTNQKIYVVAEDLTIVVAGFTTNQVGLLSYLVICILSLGLGYLVLRWLPRWRVRFIGSSKPLFECDWVVVEVRSLSCRRGSKAAAKVDQNQWGEFTVQDIARIPYGHSASTVFGLREEKSVSHEYDEDDDPVMLQLRFLDYRYIRFCFHPLKDKFVLCSDWNDPNWTDVRSIRAGLDSEERQRREQVFDKNQIDIQQKSIPQLLVDEAFHPFYIFQIASLILWSLDQYYYYAICIFFISIISITTTLIETKSTMKRLREISRFECEVRVLRNGFWRQVESSELVPGDIYEVSDPSLTQFPCDSLLLAGDCVVNESMLTGESVPVSKIPATDESLYLMKLSAASMNPEVARHFLFSGTKIVRARRPQEGQDDEAVALAMVVRTGFNTTKGSLVRSMLFPKPSGFKFYKDAFRYISVMACIAGVGFIASFINFVHLELAWHLIIVRALDLITIVVPPALPATLSIGTNFALSRLKKKNIFCISPQRVNVGGKLDVICFDKTGTLTEDGLDVLGVRVVHRPAMRFSDVLGDSSALLPGAAYERDPTVDYEIHKAVLYTMATCHSLRVVDDDFLGDPLDVKMFEFTGWSFQELAQKTNLVDEEDGRNSPSSIARPPAGMEYGIDGSYDCSENAPIELGNLKSFEFVSQLRRASVVVGQSGSSGGDVYVKGAPECMRDICHSDSFPVDYEELLSFYTQRGFRVIACATKHIESLSWTEVQQMKRQEAESNLEFLGFIIFENKLKPSTTGVIDELNDADIRKVMCTGDNILTAISVARECNLINRTAHCFIPHFVEGDYQGSKGSLKWQSVDNSLFELDEDTLMPLPPPAEGDASLLYDVSNLRNYSLAVSGDVFRWIIEFGSENVLKRMLARGQIFARMSPDEKHELVEKLQSIDYCCGFCGDGANDCGALKAADVGISLSEAEASVAAPFTSRVFDISCVPQVIREGRAALVTSFCCFKYMSIYSAIQFTSVSFLYASASNLGDFQFLFIDIFLVLPVAIFMGWTGAYPVLCRKRPTASLVSRKVLTPLLGQISLCILVQLIGFELVQRQPWFIPPKLDTEQSNIVNSENTTLFLISCLQYIFSGIVLSVGPPFRQSMRNNLPFVVTIVATFLFSAYMLFDPGAWLANLMQLTTMSVDFKVVILALALGGLACAWIAERRVFSWITRLIGKAHDVLWPHRRKKRREYKLVLAEMR